MKHSPMNAFFLLFFLGGIIRSAFHLQVLITLKSVKFLPTQSCGNRDAEKLSN